MTKPTFVVGYNFNVRMAFASPAEANDWFDKHQDIDLHAAVAQFDDEFMLVVDRDGNTLAAFELGCPDDFADAARSIHGWKIEGEA